MKNPVHAKFCHACGNYLHAADSSSRAKSTKEEGSAPYQPIYPISFFSQTPVSGQIKEHFFKAFKERVSIQSHLEQYSAYLEVFYSSGFSYFVEQNAILVEKSLFPLRMAADSPRAAVKIDQMLEDAFEKLLDRFTVEHTRHLNDIQLANAVLRYEETLEISTLDVEQMLWDYLDLEREQDREKIYTDFRRLPLTKIRNASKSFLFPAKNEPILVIGDQSVLGSCREGFAFTNQALYWRAHFNKPQKVAYTELHDVRRVEEWLTINDRYFYINKSLNFKVLKFLKKLKSVS